MFQTFTSASDTADVAERVARLRALMGKLRLDAYLVPRADQYQGEYVPPCAERLRWLTGFSGSAGSAVIARKSAALFVDGRYTVQVRAETDLDLFEIQMVPEQTVTDWLKRELKSGAVVGFDPWLHTLAGAESLAATLKKSGIRLAPVSRNLVDRVWGRERPAAPAEPVIVHPVKYAGTSAADKLAALQKQLKEDGQDATVLTLPDSICWLFNIRGRDVAHNPVTLAFAIVPASGKAELFIDAAKLGEDARAHLQPLAKVSALGDFAGRLKTLGVRAKTAKGKASGGRIRLDADKAAAAIARALGPRAVARGRDLCIDPKAKKCAAEIKGTRAAHLRDGIAMAKFLCWLDAQTAASAGLDEVTAVKQLEQFRRASNLLRDISFPTISGSGPNGAIVHYRVTEATNRRLGKGELFLIDSGGQYADGTTDITRTVAIGQPTQEMRTRYTAVLKAHVTLSLARFPAGTRGVALDAIARRPLWDLGLDYDHGTGHGVGSYLSVHEGPAGIAKAAMVGIEAGMILSNEPGFYLAGAYGIRIENLVLVKDPAIPDGGERAMLSFETLTLAPYDRRLIVAAALSPAERSWVDAYHARVLAEVGPSLEGANLAWLKTATAALT